MMISQKALLRGLQLLVVAGVIFLQYQNCSSYNDPSPFELGSGPGPLTSPDQISLSTPSNQSDLMTSYRYAIAFDGSCSVGDSASHYIEFQISNGSGPIVISPDLSGCADTDTAKPACTLIRDVKCEHGRYHLLISAQRRGFCPASGYLAYPTLTGQLVTKDSTGVESRVVAGQMPPYAFQLPKIFKPQLQETICP